MVLVVLMSGTPRYSLRVPVLHRYGTSTAVIQNWRKYGILELGANLLPVDLFWMRRHISKTPDAPTPDARSTCTCSTFDNPRILLARLDRPTVGRSSVLCTTTIALVLLDL